MLLNIVRIFFFRNPQELNHLFYLSMNQTHVMIVYSWIDNIMINYFSQSSWFEYQSVQRCAFKEGRCMTNRKTKECRPTQIKIKDNNEQNKSRLKNKKFRSMSTQLREGSTEPDIDGTNILQKHLFYTNKDSKNYPFINIGTSIPNFIWKFTKNRSHIISNRFLFGYSL